MAPYPLLNDKVAIVTGAASGEFLHLFLSKSRCLLSDTSFKDMGKG